MTTEEAGVRDRLEKEIEQYKADDLANKEKLLALQKVSNNVLITLTLHEVEKKSTCSCSSMRAQGPGLEPMTYYMLGSSPKPQATIIV